MSEFMIKDAESFYSMIKGNPLYKGLDDEGMVRALREYYQGTKNILASLSGVDEEEFLFFQGMLAGSLVMAKIFRHHVATEASAANIDPTTGKKYGDSN